MPAEALSKRITAAFRSCDHDLLACMPVARAGSLGRQLLTLAAKRGEYSPSLRLGFPRQPERLASLLA